MVSEKQKTELGEALIGIGFVQATFSLPFIPLNPFSLLLSPLELPTAHVLAVSGVTGFILFLTGVELWKRNRTHWKDI
ncbi:MAG: hypothetical protein BRC30_02110 [Nanohaloarchaea archaeon SW_7_46_7]|nr:MAG: hypothetical protein BRC30_02110 [Nanohaloarchaea archaeon SW_7_46_7]